MTAFDSTTDNSVTTELGGRRCRRRGGGRRTADSRVRERTQGVWVVPNPYRGYAQIQQRPSAWDLIARMASDPTGTHIDFLGLPAGKWTIRIFTVSGDLVQELHSSDPVNESRSRHGTGRQRDACPVTTASRTMPTTGRRAGISSRATGRTCVSGIYLFTVDSTQRYRSAAKFVVSSDEAGASKEE